MFCLSSGSRRETSFAKSGLEPRAQKMRGMPWYDYVAYFFGGAFIANAIPHFVSGVMGRAFQSPFAKPPGQGLSSSTVNVGWGALNFIVAYVLIVHVGSFDLHDWTDAGALAIGAILMAVGTARFFGRFHGGNSLPTETICADHGAMENAR